MMELLLAVRRPVQVRTQISSIAENLEDANDDDATAQNVQNDLNKTEDHISVTDRA